MEASVAQLHPESISEIISTATEPISAKPKQYWKPDYANDCSITGTITRTFYATEKFTTGKIAINNAVPWDNETSFCIQGAIPSNTEVTLRGGWVNDPKWGWQFKANAYDYPMPDLTSTGAGGLAAYLTNESTFKGIGPVKAALIADAFGVDFDRIIREEPERIAEVGKLKMEQVQLIRESWIERSAVNAISTWLADYGLTANQIKKIATQYGNAAQSILLENPYKLMDDLEGFGFLRTDIIALKMGVEKNHPGRIRACILHTIDEIANKQGHTWVDLSSLIKGAVENLYLDDRNASTLVREAVIALTNIPASGEQNPPLVLVVAGDPPIEYISLRWLYHQEMTLYNWFREYSDKPGVPDVDSAKTVDEAIKTYNVTLESAQLDAVVAAVDHRLSIITGGAGTGKSFTIKTIRQILASLDRDTAVAAPTGKAARRLVNDSIPATTIHRLLAYSAEAGGFTYTADNKLPYGAIIIDEVSMCAIPLLYSLLSAIDIEKTIVVFVGDQNQLPPIGPGNVLRDCINNSILHTTELTVCYRNAGKLKSNCSAILHGHLEKKKSKASPLDPTYEWFVVDDRDEPQEVVDLLCLMMNEQFDSWGYDPISECQIITPQRKGPLGTNRLNLELQKVWQLKRYGRELPELQFRSTKDYDRKPKLYPGDKIMQIKNDYKLDDIHGGIMNGTGGVIKAITQAPGASKSFYSVEFEDRDNLVEIEVGSDQADNLNLAYAVTVHKCQGSQYVCVVSIVHRIHAYSLSRNLLYTAVTRARLSSIIIGEPVGIRRAIHTVTPMQRNTWMGLLSGNMNTNLNGINNE